MAFPLVDRKESKTSRERSLQWSTQRGKFTDVSMYVRVKGGGGRCSECFIRPFAEYFRKALLEVWCKINAEVLESKY